MKLLKHYLSTDKIAIGIHGSGREEVEQKFYSFYNWRATDGEFHWMNEGNGGWFGFFWTTLDKLDIYLRNASLNYAIIHHSNSNKGKPGGINQIAKKIEEEWRNSFQEEKFLPKFTPIYEAFRTVEEKAT